jgi:hypothetical protein
MSTRASRAEARASRTVMEPEVQRATLAAAKKARAASRLCMKHAWTVWRQACEKEEVINTAFNTLCEKETECSGYNTWEFWQDRSRWSKELRALEVTRAETRNASQAAYALAEKATQIMEAFKYM